MSLGIPAKTTPYRVKDILTIEEHNSFKKGAENIFPQSPSYYDDGVLHEHNFFCQSQNSYGYFNQEIFVFCVFISALLTDLKLVGLC